MAHPGARLTRGVVCSSQTAAGTARRSRGAWTAPASAARLCQGVGGSASANLMVDTTASSASWVTLSPAYSNRYVASGSSTR